MHVRAALLIVFASIASAAHAAVLTVTGTGDTIAVDGLVTLREAITAANTNAPSGDSPAGDPGLDTIAFNIGAGGAQTIAVTAAALPTITEAVNIDGTTQPGYSGTNLIFLNGAGAPIANGLRIASSAPCTITSLIIGNFGLNGVLALSNGNTLRHNSIGVLADGTTAAPNTGNGIEIRDASGNVIGGTAATDGNTISRNTLNGILLSGASLTTIQRNLIENNGQSGIHLGPGLVATTSDDNLIGAATTGGVGGNRMFFNGSASVNGVGVRVASGVRNRISTNSLGFNGPFSPTAVGIDLGVDGRTANDACDPDTGPNQLQNDPVLARAVVSGGTTTVNGTFEAGPLATYTLEFYWNAPAGLEQAEVFLGSTTVTATCSTSFNITFPFAVPTFPVPFYSVTALAIDPSGNTSELSQPVFARPALDVTKSFSPTQITPNGTSQLTITIDNLDPQGPGDSNLSLSDTYPAGLVNATAPSPSSSCGGSFTAVPGAGSFSFSGGNAQAGTCTISLFVTAATAASYTNTINAQSVTTNQTYNAAPANATLNVVALAAPGVTKTFTPTSVRPGQPSTLTITLTNSNNQAITGVAFTDNYPSGLANTATPNGATTCGGTVTAPGGGSSLALSNGTIPANGSCTVTAQVTLTSNSSAANTLPAGAVTSANASPSGGAASATLAAETDIPALSMLMVVLMAALVATAALLRMR